MLIKAKLESYLGFYIVQLRVNFLICDFQELYHYLTDDFVVQYCKKLNRRDFTFKPEDFSAKRKEKKRTSE